MNSNKTSRKLHKVERLSSIVQKMHFDESQLGIISLQSHSPFASQNSSLLYAQGETSNNILNTSRKRPINLNENFVKEHALSQENNNSKSLVSSKGCRLKIKDEIFIRDQEIAMLTEQKQLFETKLKKIKREFVEMQELVQPYIGNVTMMSAIFDSLGNLEPKHEEKITKNKNGLEPESLIKFQLQGLISKSNEIILNNDKLKDEIHILKIEIVTLRSILKEKDIYILSLLEEKESLTSTKEFSEKLLMCNEDLMATNLELFQERQKAEIYKEEINKMNLKIKRMTAMISNSVVCDVKYETCLKSFIAEVDSIFSNKIETVIDLKNEFKYKKLSKGNYDIMFKEGLLGQEKTEINVNPSFLTLLRGILDTKYLDYKINEQQTCEFSEFVNTFLARYTVGPDKKIYANILKISESEAVALNNNFNRSLFHPTITNLYEIVAFKEFLFDKVEKDEIYFYLSCRNRMAAGSELQNSISSSDAMKLVRYDESVKLVMEIAEWFGNSIKSELVYYLGTQKIIKKGKSFLKLYYILRMLQLIYRKHKIHRLKRMKEFFEESLTFHKAPMDFNLFNFLLKKCFSFVPRTLICKYFISTVHSLKFQTETSFFECFYATHSEAIFFDELKIFFSSLDQKINVPKPSNEINILMGLIPTAVSNIGFSTINLKYDHLLEQNYDILQTKVDTLHFLTTILETKLTHIGFRTKKEFYNVIDSINKSLIKETNELEKNENNLAKNINKASQAIGKWAKKKLFKYYEELLKQI